MRSRGREAKLAARDALRAPRLADLARLDDAQFRALFAKTSIKRTGRDRFVRNVLIAIGNSGDKALAIEAERLLDDPRLWCAAPRCGRCLDYCRVKNSQLSRNARAIPIRTCGRNGTRRLSRTL